MTLSATDRALIDGWRQEVRLAFDACIGDAERVAFLMYPYDGNVGNHMMWLALVDYLHTRRIRIVYAAHHMNFRVDHLRRVIGTDPILFSGGVTLSRLWPEHPQVRRLVAEEFPHNRIVSLTSTMIFVDEDDEVSASSIFGTHQHVVVMARDPRSAHNAVELFPSNVQVVTAPDSAFGLPIEEPRIVKRVPFIWLERDDSESARVALPEAVRTFDWSNDLRHAYPKAYLALRFGGIFSRLRATRWARPLDRPSNRVIVWSYVRASREILIVGHRSLDQASVLITDRMHPHILSAMRGQDVVLLPDRYGKNRAVYDYLTRHLDCVHWADEPREAETLARRLAEPT